MRRAQAINAVGAVFTAVVLVVVFATKVTHGAWIAVAAMIVLFIAMRAINRYYTRVTVEVAADDEQPNTLPSRVHALVLVSRLHKPAMQALALARGMRPDVHLRGHPVRRRRRDPQAARRNGRAGRIPVPLTDARRALPGPDPAPARLRQGAAPGNHPRTVIMVFIPEYVVTHWWQQLLHNQSALRFKARLLFTPGVVVVSVPYHLGVASTGAPPMSAPSIGAGFAGFGVSDSPNHRPEPDRAVPHR